MTLSGKYSAAMSAQRAFNCLSHIVLENVVSNCDLVRGGCAKKLLLKNIHTKNTSNDKWKITKCLSTRAVKELKSYNQKSIINTKNYLHII